MKTVTLILVDKKELADILTEHKESVDKMIGEFDELIQLKQITRGTLFKIIQLPTYKLTHEVEE